MGGPVSITLAKRPGDYAVYENKRTGVRFHIETSSQRGLWGVENTSEGVSLCPRTKEQVERLIAKHRLTFVEIGWY
jgi:hypothetical protein